MKMITNGKIKFTNSIYEFILKAILLSLIIGNGFALFRSFTWQGLNPLLLNLALFLIIMKRHVASKKLVKWWVAIVFILAPLIVVLVALFRSSIEVTSVDSLLRYAKIVFGVFLFLGAERFMEVIKEEKLGIEDHLVE